MGKTADSSDQMIERWSALEEVRSRVARLERSRIRERVLMLVVLVILFGGAWLTGQSGDGTDVVQTQRLEILDDGGRVRASMDAADGIPMFALRDSKGVARVVLEVEANGDPGISLNDQDGIGRALIALGGGRYPFLEFYDPKTAEPKISMAIIRRGDAFLHIYDKERSDYWKAP